jgi:D-aminopeptidase
MDFINDEEFDVLYEAGVEAIEEAVIKAQLGASDMPTLRPPGRICRAINHEHLLDVMRRYGRCA